MKIKYSVKMSFFVVLSVVLILSVNLIGSAATRDWYVGTSVKFTYSMSESESAVEVIDGLRGFDGVTMEMELRIVLLEIDLENHEYIANLTMSDDIYEDYESSTDPAMFSEVLGEYLMYIDYSWDDNSNRLLLTDFDMTYEFLAFFIEPDWDVVNTNMEQLLDMTQIVDTVTVDTTTYEITLGEFLDSINSFNIMGVSDTTGSQVTLSSTATKWSFDLDLSNVINKRIYNYDTQQYSFTPYSRYIVSFILEFTNGGTLEILEYDIITEYTSDDIREEEEYKFVLKQGDLDSLNTPFDFSYAVLSLMVIPAIFFFQKKKSKKVSGGGDN